MNFFLQSYDEEDDGRFSEAKEYQILVINPKYLLDCIEHDQILDFYSHSMGMDAKVYTYSKELLHLLITTNDHPIDTICLAFHNLQWTLSLYFGSMTIQIVLLFCLFIAFSSQPEKKKNSLKHTMISFKWKILLQRTKLFIFCPLVSLTASVWHCLFVCLFFFLLLLLLIQTSHIGLIFVQKYYAKLKGPYLHSIIFFFCTLCLLQTISGYGWISSYLLCNANKNASSSKVLSSEE